MSPSKFNPLGPAHYISQESENADTGYAVTRVGVFYATREGHTRRIADHIAGDLCKLGFDVDAQDVKHPLKFKLDRYSTVVLAASVHAGSHEPEMVKFVRENRSTLESMPSAFISVTLSEAGVENSEATPAEHTKFAADVDQMLGKFFAETLWHPTRVKPVAGALLYTQYNFLVRFIMKRIARKAGAATDTSRDYDYTDWGALDKFVEEFASEIRSSVAASDLPRMPTATCGGASSYQHEQ
jgi:menaquinone-dependent protoporphyrinogen oxidase